MTTVSTVSTMLTAARTLIHAAASVRLDVVEGVLQIEVRDDGRSTEPWTAGVGTASMRERAAEVGGTLTAAGGPDGGRVVALLPLAGRAVIVTGPTGTA